MTTRMPEMYPHASDEELLGSLADSHPEAFGEFYRRHVREVLAYFARATGSPQEAADLTAETFATALVARRRFVRRKAEPVAWLMGIAKNQLRRHVRKGVAESRARARLGMQRLIVAGRDADELDALIDAQRSSAKLRQALGAVRMPLREALILRIGLELPYEEVAGHLGCSVGAARVRVFRGLEQLSRHMEGVSS